MHLRLMHHSIECCLQFEKGGRPIGHQIAAIRDRVWRECDIVHHLHQYSFHCSATGHFNGVEQWQQSIGCYDRNQCDRHNRKANDHKRVDRTATICCIADGYQRGTDRL